MRADVTDLLDRRGRVNRHLTALVCGIAGGIAAGYASYGLAGIDYESGNRGAGRFILMSVGAAFAIVFELVHLALIRRDKRRWEAERLPAARIRR